MKKIIPYILLGAGAIAAVTLLSSCASKPPKAEPVSNFQLNNYLGKWYELARIDFRQEKNLDNTTANYSLNDNGTVKVINKGYNVVKNEWKEAKGKAKFRGEENVGALKVSFFGPFYSGYNVLAIDKNYKYVLVGGKNLDYLWILSREKTIPENVKNDYLAKAKAIGYDTNRLIWIKHDKN